MCFFNSINPIKNVYPSAILNMKNGETKTIDNVQFYSQEKNAIVFYCFDSIGKKKQADIIIKLKDVDFIQWR